MTHQTIPTFGSITSSMQMDIDRINFPTGETVSHLEDEYLFQIRAAGIPLPRLQYQLVKDRKYRWDFAWPEMLLCVEINGGTWVKSGHTTGKGLDRDAEKLNLAVLRGYHQFVFTKEMIRDGRALAWTQEAFRIYTPF